MPGSLAAFWNRPAAADIFPALDVYKRQAYINSNTQDHAQIIGETRESEQGGVVVL